MCEYNNTGQAGLSFYRKYELERLVHKQEPKTFRARALTTGRPVFLHLLGGLERGERGALLDKLRRVAAAGNAAILEIDDSSFAPYVATAVLESFQGLPDWLDAQSRMPMPPAVSPDDSRTQTVLDLRPPRTPSDEPRQHDFSRTTPVMEMPPAAAPPQPAAEAAEAPGEFTRMFTGAVPPKASDAGEFSKLFGAPLGETSAPAPIEEMPPAAAPPAPEDRPPSTMPVAPPPLETPRTAAPTAAPDMPRATAPPGEHAGEFTRLFGGKQEMPAAKAPLAAAAAGQPGEFTRLFGAPPPAPADVPAGFAPPPKPAAPEAPRPWEPAAQPRPTPVIETPDTQKASALKPPPLPPPREDSGFVPASAPALESSAPAWSPPPAPARQPDVGGTGEFTRFFASPLASSSLPIEEIEQGRMPEPAAPSNRPFEGPGEFTRWYGSNVPGKSAAEEMPPAQRPTFSGAATNLFGNEPPLGPSSQAMPAAAGPSDYTRMMGGPSSSEAQIPPGAVPVAPGPAGGPSRLPVIVSIAAVVVVLFALALVLILTRAH